MKHATVTIAAEADRFAEVLTGPDPSAPVPTCPDWTAVDLLWHLTETHELWAQVLATHAMADEDVEKIEGAKAPRPEGPGARNQLMGRREAATAALVAQLEERGDAEAAWSWFEPDQSVGFTRRMQVHEATMHRVDAELTANTPVSAIDEDLARDGLDQAVGVMWAGSWEWVPEWARIDRLAVLTLAPASGAPIEVEIARWSGTRPRDGEEFSQLLARPLPEGDDPGDLPRAMAAGSAVALYLWVWGREVALERMEEAADVGNVELTGDETAVGHVRDRIAQGMD